MSRWIYLARFFVVVPPMPLLMVGAFVVITMAAAAVIIVEPSRAAGALTPILLLQLFGNSSGFDIPARRGHYDLLLTHGHARRRIIVGHWAASALPGVICWIVLGAVCRSVQGAGGASLFSAGTATAVGLLSTIPWAITARLPRFSGAIGWLLLVAMLSLIAPRMMVFDVTGLSHWRTWVETASAVLVFPPLLVGQRLEGADGLVVVPALLFAFAALNIAFWSVNRRDIPLEAAQ